MYQVFVQGKVIKRELTLTIQSYDQQQNADATASNGHVEAIFIIYNGFKYFRTIKSDITAGVTTADSSMHFNLLGQLFQGRSELLNFHSGFFFFSFFKVFSQKMFSILLRASNHQFVGEKN